MKKLVLLLALSQAVSPVWAQQKAKPPVRNTASAPTAITPPTEEEAFALGRRKQDHLVWRALVKQGAFSAENLMTVGQEANHWMVWEAIARDPRLSPDVLRDIGTRVEIPKEKKSLEEHIRDRGRTEPKPAVWLAILNNPRVQDHGNYLWIGQLANDPLVWDAIFAKDSLFEGWEIVRLADRLKQNPDVIKKLFRKGKLTPDEALDFCREAKSPVAWEAAYNHGLLTSLLKTRSRQAGGDARLLAVTEDVGRYAAVLDAAVSTGLLTPEQMLGLLREPNREDDNGGLWFSVAATGLAKDPRFTPAVREQFLRQMQKDETGASTRALLNRVAWTDDELTRLAKTSYDGNLRQLFFERVTLKNPALTPDSLLRYVRQLNRTEYWRLYLKHHPPFAKQPTASAMIEWVQKNGATPPKPQYVFTNDSPDWALWSALLDTYPLPSAELYQLGTKLNNNSLWGNIIASKRLSTEHLLALSNRPIEHYGQRQLMASALIRAGSFSRAQLLQIGKTYDDWSAWSDILTFNSDKLLGKNPTLAKLIATGREINDSYAWNVLLYKTDRKPASLVAFGKAANDHSTWASIFEMQPRFSSELWLQVLQSTQDPLVWLYALDHGAVVPKSMLLTQARKTNVREYWSALADLKLISIAELLQNMPEPPKPQAEAIAEAPGGDDLMMEGGGPVALDMGSGYREAVNAGIFLDGKPTFAKILTYGREENHYQTWLALARRATLTTDEKLTLGHEANHFLVWDALLQRLDLATLSASQLFDIGKKAAHWRVWNELVYTNRLSPAELLTVAKSADHSGVTACVLATGKLTKQDLLNAGVPVME